MKYIHYYLLLLLYLPLHAKYDNDILKVHATILPKIIFMDYNFKKKIYKNKILIALVCDKNHYNEAIKFRELIYKKYTNEINGYKLQIDIINASDIKENHDKKSIYYLFPTITSEIIQIINTLKNSNAIVFSFDKKDLQYGSNISLNIGKKIRPILNMASLKKKNISLASSLINISEIYYIGKK